MDLLDRAADLRRHLDADPTDADAHLELAQVLRALEDFKDATAAAERACELRDGFADAEAMAALCRHMTGEVDAAWPHYERALRLCDPDPVLYFNAGVAADALARTADAIHLYTEALRLQPDYASALNNLGIALASAGRYAAAVRTLHTLLEMPGAPNRHLAFSNLGLAYHYLGRLDDALQAFDAALALEPTFAVAYCNLGNVLYAKGWADRAADMYRKAIEHDPDNVQAYRALGTLGDERREGADPVVEEYERYLDRHPWSALVYYNLGMALAARGKTEEARVQFDKALFLEPRFREAQQARAALELGRTSQED